MGLELSEDVIRENMPEYLPENQAALLPRPSVSILIYIFNLANLVNEIQSAAIWYLLYVD